MSFLFYIFFWLVLRERMSQHHFLYFFLLLPPLGRKVGEILMPQHTIFPHGAPLAVETPGGRLDTLRGNTPVTVPLCSLPMWLLNSLPVVKLLPPTWHFLPLTGGSLPLRPTLLPGRRLVVEEITSVLSVICLCNLYFSITEANIR